MSNCYCYVLPSEMEELSTGLLEALAYGCCVLTSDVEENLEALGDSGLTFQSKNVQDLKRQLQYLLENEEAARSFRIKASERAASLLNWDQVADRFEALYHSLIHP